MKTVRLQNLDIGTVSDYESTDLTVLQFRTWPPIDIMEHHANKLPGFILIQDKPGKAYARKLMKSYGGQHTIQNLDQLVRDVAAHFGTPLSMARRRLIELGCAFLQDHRIPADSML